MCGEHQVIVKILGQTPASASLIHGVAEVSLPPYHDTYSDSWLLRVDVSPNCTYGHVANLQDTMVLWFQPESDKSQWKASKAYVTEEFTDNYWYGLNSTVFRSGADSCAAS